MATTERHSFATEHLQCPTAFSAIFQDAMTKRKARLRRSLVTSRSHAWRRSPTHAMIRPTGLGVTERHPAKDHAMPTICLARQPIFDRDLKVVAYELLFR